MNLNHISSIPDKRADVRHPCEVTIRWSYFNQETYFDGKMLNFSAGGVYIETASEIKTGSTIYIKLEGVASSQTAFGDQQGPRYVSLGEVVWRAELSGKDRHYGAGVRYPFSDYA